MLRDYSSSLGEKEVMDRQWPYFIMIIRQGVSEEKFWEWLSVFPVRGVWQIAERTWKVYLENQIEMTKPAFAESLVRGVENNEEWAEKWRETFQPIRVGKNLSVRPPWEKHQNGTVEVVIYPAYAFGTGDHPTTILCMEKMECYLKPGMDVLDIGTGSGILAFLACKLGAHRVCALDRDPLSITEVKRNLILNDINANRLELILGTPGKVKGAFEMVVANVGYAFHQYELDTLTRFLHEGGFLLLSGVTPFEAKELKKTIQGKVLRLVDESERNEWTILVYNKVRIR